MLSCGAREVRSPCAWRGGPGRAPRLAYPVRAVSFPAAQSAPFPLSTLNSSQGALKVNSCSKTGFSPHRERRQMPLAYKAGPQPTLRPGSKSQGLSSLALGGKGCPCLYWQLETFLELLWSMQRTGFPLCPGPTPVPLSTMGTVQCTAENCSCLMPCFPLDLAAVSNLDVESKLSVYYRAPWHQQRNIFLPVDEKARGLNSAILSSVVACYPSHLQAP